MPSTRMTTWATISHAFYTFYLLKLLPLCHCQSLLYDQRCIQCIEIDVYFHATALDDGAITIHNQTATASSMVPQLQSALDIVNLEFENTPFLFRWVQQLPSVNLNNTNVTYDLCGEGRRDMADRLVRHEEWNATYANLHIYLGHQMYIDNPLPSGCASTPWFTYIQDNPTVYVSYEKLPPVGNSLTIVHEIGHWLGLFHTFEDFYNVNKEDPCDIRNVNDWVEDTPPQIQFEYNFSLALFGDANETVDSFDSCPNFPGQDSFFNHMNTVCKGRECYGDRGFFTEGQIQRMYMSWLIYYRKDEECGEEGRLFSIELRRWSTDQVVIYTQDGLEIYNAHESFLQVGRERKNVVVDLCLRHEEQYVVVLTKKNRWDRFQTIFWQDGESILKSSDLNSVDGFLASFVLPSSSTDQKSNQTLNEVAASKIETYDAGVDDCPADQVLLEVDTWRNETDWMAIFTSGNGVMIDMDEDDDVPLRYCIPQNHSEPITVLAAFSTSDAPYYEVRRNGKTILRREGPFYTPLFSFPGLYTGLYTGPRIITALLTQQPPTQQPKQQPTQKTIELPPTHYSQARSCCAPTMIALTALLVSTFLLINC